LLGSLVVWIAGGWIAAVCLALVVAAPMLVLGAGGERARDAMARLEPFLDRLEQVRGPAQQRFFVASSSRVDLARDLLARER